jgi:hypothetical protein
LDEGRNGQAWDEQEATRQLALADRYVRSFEEDGAIVLPNEGRYYKDIVEARNQKDFGAFLAALERWTEAVLEEWHARTKGEIRHVRRNANRYRAGIPARAKERSFIPS